MKEARLLWRGACGSIFGMKGAHRTLNRFVQLCFWCFWALLLVAPGAGQDEVVDPELSDAEIEARLEERLGGMEGLSNAQVEVDGGVVVLSGEVDQSEARARAAEVARAQEGVVDVRNELVLGGEVREVVGNAFDRSLLKLRMLLGYLPLFVAAVVIILLSALAARWIASPALVRRLAGRNRFLAEVVRQILRVAILLAGLLIALDLLDATALVGAVFGAAGLAGLAIGFAFKDLIENYVSSVLLSLRRPFMPNDHVVIDGHEGVVVSLNTRATTLMTLEGNHLRLPNSLVFKSVMLNYTRNAERRFDFAVGVGVNEDLSLAQRVGVKTLRAMEGVLDDPAPLALVTGLAESSVTVLFLGWVDQTKADYGKVKGEAIRLVKLALEGEGIDLPEPTYRVQLTGGEEPVGYKPATPVAKNRAREDPVGTQGDISLESPLARQLAEEKERTRGRNLLTEETPPE